MGFYRLTRLGFGRIIRKGIRPSIILLSLILFLLITNFPTPQGLSVEGQKSLAIFVVCIILWVTHALPLMITSLLAVILFPLTGVLSTAESYSLFGNRAIFFILGAFILASAIMRSGLSTRLALLALRNFGNSPKSLLLGFLAFSAFLSFWMSEHAVAAMMFPIVLEVVSSLKLMPPQSRYGKGLFLAMTWGCIVGGITTFLGGARAPLSIGILRQTTGLTIDFVHWALAALPTVVLMITIVYFILIRMYSPEIQDIQEALIVLKRKQLRMGRISPKEKAVGILMVMTIFFWIFYGEKLGLANIAIGAVVIAFVFRLLDWKEVEEDVNWGIFLMYGGAICLGVAMEMTGAAHWVADKTLGYFVHSVWGLVLSISFIALFLTEAISNTAVVALMMPLVLGFAAYLK
ncbi:MAG: SLC13 family permease, partial [bacterium]